MDEQNQQQSLPPQQPVVPPQNVNPPPVPQQSLYGKRNWLKWGLIYLVIAVLIYGGIYYLAIQQKKSSPYSTNPPSQTISQPSPTPDLTANWKTYTSRDESFSFKYPTGWISEIKDTILEMRGKKYNAHYVTIGRPFTEQQIKVQQEYWGKKDVSKIYNDFSLVYSTNPDFKNLTRENLVDDLITSRTIDYQKGVLLNKNVPAKEVGYGCQGYCINILFKNNNTIFNSSTGPNADANIDNLRQILSTFRFD